MVNVVTGRTELDCKRCGCTDTQPHAVPLLESCGDNGMDALIGK